VLCLVVRRLEMVLSYGFRCVIAGLSGLLFLCFLVMPALASVSSEGFVDVSCGNGFILALREDGTVWTWGALGCEKYGEGLDLREYWVQPSPVQVPISDVISVSAGSRFSLALKSDGTVWGWGFNDYGMLGDGTNVSTRKGDLTPVQVKNLNNIMQISAKGSRCLALRNDGTVWSWGDNYGGCLGDGSFENRFEPVMVSGLTNITSIQGGSFALKDDGTVWTWGLTLLNSSVTRDDLSSPSSQEFTSSISKPVPYRIPGIEDVKSIDVDTSSHHVVFVKADGTVRTWGFNEGGQLGDGTANQGEYAPYQTTPTQVEGIINAKSAVAGRVNSLALCSDGSVLGWGENNALQLGLGISTIYLKPTKLSITNITKISTGDTNTVFLKDDGSVLIVGGNNVGQRGDGSIGDPIKAPVKVLGPQNIDNGFNDTTPGPALSSINNSSQQTNADVNPQKSMWLSLTVIALALIIFVTGCVILFTKLRKM
jgi:alpha-tubulin suppressor-like RCC1 family protein